MPMKDEPEGEDLNGDGKKGHGKVPAFLEEEKEEIGEDLDKLKGGLKDYMKNKADEKKDEKKEELDEASCGTGDEKRMKEESLNKKLEEAIARIAKAKNITYKGKKLR